MQRRRGPARYFRAELEMKRVNGAQLTGSYCGTTWSPNTLRLFSRRRIEVVELTLFLSSDVRLGDKVPRAGRLLEKCAGIRKVPVRLLNLINSTGNRLVYVTLILCVCARRQQSRSGDGNVEKCKSQLGHRHLRCYWLSVGSTDRDTRGVIEAAEAVVLCTLSSDSNRSSASRL